MKIDGKQIADEILQKLQSETLQLKQKNVVPTLAVILVGDNPASVSYIRQKEKAAAAIEAEVRVMKYAMPAGRTSPKAMPTARRQDVRVTKEEIQNVIHQLNTDPNIHGIIIQRPLPIDLQDLKLLNSVNPNKDVDGFVPNTKYQVPVGMAVEKILQKIYEVRFMKYEEKQFLFWLTKQQIVIVGRGETAGKPIANHIQLLIRQLRFNRSQASDKFHIIHSKTTQEEKTQLLKQADSIISCVGKMRIITPGMVKKGVILISVGISRDQNGALLGDYEEEEIKDIASFYTPTPGGVGPVNVACLMSNLIRSATSTKEQV